MARQFLASTEARRNIVKDQFLRFLDRFPTTAEANTWVVNLASSRAAIRDGMATLTPLVPHVIEELSGLDEG